MVVEAPTKETEALEEEALAALDREHYLHQLQKALTL